MDSTPSFPSFDDLKPTTVAAMIYFNATVDFQKIYERLTVVPIDERIDSLKKRDKKLNLASIDKGLLLSVRYHDRLRGYPKASTKKKWCGICQLVVLEDEKQVKVKTAVAKHVHIGGDEYQIKFWCRNCKGTYSAKEMGFLDHFKNQLMVDITSGHNTVNLMIFQGKMKIAGCNSELEPLTLAAFFWHNYIRPVEGCWTLNLGETKLKMVTKTVMCNINFNFGMNIDLERLVAMWLDEEYGSDVIEAKESNTSQKNVKVRFAYDPESDADVGYNLLTFLGKGPQVTIRKVEEVPFAYTKKPGKVVRTTAIVFTTSATILSGLNMAVNRSRFEFFRRAIEKNAEDVKEVCTQVDRQALRALLT